MNPMRPVIALFLTWGLAFTAMATPRGRQTIERIVAVINEEIILLSELHADYPKAVAGH